MPITVDELPGLLEEIAAKVSRTAPDMAMAMGRVHEGWLKNVTLVQSGSHGPATAAGYPPAAARGDPPMMMTGRLRASVTCVPAGGGGTYASSDVGPHTVYSRTQEFGGVHSGDMFLWVRYVGPDVVIAKNWRKRQVAIGPHPFVRPSRDAVIANGWVTAAGSASFERQVWG